VGSTRARAHRAERPRPAAQEVTTASRDPWARPAWRGAASHTGASPARRATARPIRAECPPPPPRSFSDEAGAAQAVNAAVMSLGADAARAALARAAGAAPLGIELAGGGPAPPQHAATQPACRLMPCMGLPVAAAAAAPAAAGGSSGAPKRPCPRPAARRPLGRKRRPREFVVYRRLPGTSDTYVDPRSGAIVPACPSAAPPLSPDAALLPLLPLPPDGALLPALPLLPALAPPFSFPDAAAPLPAGFPHSGTSSSTAEDLMLTPPVWAAQAAQVLPPSTPPTSTAPPPGGAGSDAGASGCSAALYTGGCLGGGRLGGSTLADEAAAAPNALFLPQSLGLGVPPALEPSEGNRAGGDALQPQTSTSTVTPPQSRDEEEGEEEDPALLECDLDLLETWLEDGSWTQR
jgi:hypothetical protein